MLLALLRRLRRIPAPAIGREKAIQLAEAEMARHGWHRTPSAPIFEELRHWVVYAIDGTACGNLAAYVDMQDGSVRAYTERGVLTAPPGSQEDAAPGSKDG